MNKLTRNGIAYDLTISPYKLVSKHESIEYVFSSQRYLDKFISEQEDNRRKINESLSNRFGYQIKNNLLCDLVLYHKIEKRGFLIFFDGVPVKCPENITLDGNNLIMNN